MKNLKNLKLLPVLLLLAIASCKKDKNEPEPDTNNGNTEVDNGITKEDLLDYYIVSERKLGSSKLSVLYFTQQGDAVKSSMHGKGYLREKEITIDHSTLNFDVNDNGKMVYTFIFEKDADGKLKLKSYQYADNEDSGQGLVYAILAKKTETIAFENSSFNTGDIQFKFTTSNGVNTLDWDNRSRQTGTKYYPPPINKTLPIFGIVPEVSLPYYSLENLGWKSNNDEFMGACVPNWKDINTPVMLVERNSTVYQSTKE